MNLNEFINELINETTTNEKICPKLGVKFDIEICKKTFIENEMTYDKFNSIGKKGFSKVCKQATIIAGPANRLYKVMSDKCKQQNEEREQQQTPNNDENNENNETISENNNENNNENNHESKTEEIDIKDKHCIDMTQNEFIEVLLNVFTEKLKDFDSNNIGNVRDVLFTNNVNYTNFLSMKSKGWTKLIKTEFNLKGAQCVSIYKSITKRIENERQKYFVPIMEKKISTISETHPRLLNKQQTQKLFDFLEKDKTIDQIFVKDPSKRDLFEAKLKKKMPSIKTGDIIVIYNKLHELVENKSTDEVINNTNNSAAQTDDENTEELVKKYISKLDEIQLSKMAKMVMNESLKKLFEQITNKMNKNGVNGSMFINHLIGKTENEFQMFFCQYIHNKCFEFSSDLYLMLNNNDNRINKIRVMNECDELCKYIIDTFIQKISELIINEDIDGLKYLELGKSGLCKKLKKYLSFGLSRKLVTNIDLYLHEAYKHTPHTPTPTQTPSIPKYSSLSYTNNTRPQTPQTPFKYSNLMDNYSNISNISSKHTPQHSLSENIKTERIKTIHIKKSSYSEKRPMQMAKENLTPRQSLSENTLQFEAIVEEENDEKEESVYSQTIGLSVTENSHLGIYSRISLMNNNNNSEEKQLVKEAIHYYKKYNKKSLQHVRKNIYKKCNINLLLPHINISVGRDNKPSVSWNDYPITSSANNNNNNNNNMKKQNLNGKAFIFTTFKSIAKSIYKINDKENTFYRTLYDDINKENNGFLNILTKYEILEWLACYEYNRVAYIIYNKHIDYKKFRCISKEKFRDNINYLGFLPQKKKKKII